MESDFFMFLVENWYMFVILAVVIVYLGWTVYRISKKDFMEIVKYAVFLAEKEYGSGTGSIKLKYAYDYITSKHTWIMMFISFEQFSKLVDEALKWLNGQLESNTNVQALMQKVG